MSLSLNSNKSLPDDENRHFRTDHLKVDLGGRTARGGVVTIASQGFKFFTGMAGTVVLARLLTPQDYGLIGMVAVIMGFVSMFKDMGLTVAIAPGVAWFYGEPRLTLITIGFAAGFLFSGLTVQHEALLRRQMRFVSLAAIEIISLIVGLTTAINLAWRGWGYWALVANQLAQGLTYAVGVWIVCSWRPGRFVRGADVRSMLAFGGNLTGFHVVNFFARNLDNMLIGLVWGGRPLGLYAKAYQLLLLPIDQINEPIASVAVPALSRLSDAPERYRKAYLRILEKLAMLTMPGMALMIATSDWMVTIVLGAQWIEASRIFALLGIAGLVQPVANTTGWLFITQNRTRHMFQWGIIGSLIIVASIVGGLPWGAVGVAASYSVVFVCVVMPLLLWFVGRDGPVRTVDFYRTIAPSLCAALSVLGALASRSEPPHLRCDRELRNHCNDKLNHLCHLAQRKKSSSRFETFIRLADEKTEDGSGARGGYSCLKFV
jgi:O-antigen/teichoic acid export membrane protein